MRKMATIALILALLMSVGCRKVRPVPEISSVTPPHNAEVALETTVSISFTRPMNRASVEAAFRITPSIQGVFVWNGNTVEFRPAEALSPGTEYIVGFATPPTDTAGTKLLDFSMKFRTIPREARVYTIYSYSWLTDGTGLVFSADIGDDQHLWVVGADGTGQQRLDNEEATQLDPAVSPDGKLVAYVSYSPKDGPGLSLYDRVRGTTTRLSLDLGGAAPGSPKFSPDGKHLAFHRVSGAADAHSDVYQDIWVYDVARKQATALEPRGDTNRLIGFSEDSGKVYFFSTHEQYNHSHNFRYDLWEMELATKAAVKLCQQGAIHNALASDMHPSSNRFVYSTWEPKDVELNIIAFPRDIFLADASNTYKQTKLSSGGSNSYPRFSPDGWRILYLNDWSGEGKANEVYVMNHDGSGPRKLTSTGKPKLFPSWSPDGGKIAFIQIEGESHSLYVMNADGSGLRQITR